MATIGRFIKFIALGLLLPLFSHAQYFQQDLKYTIHVSLDDIRHQLNGDASIVYINNSPSDLSEMYIHLWPSAYKDETTALAEQYYNAGDNRMLVAKERSFGDMDSLSFQINGEKTEWNRLEDHSDICRIKLKNALKSGDSLIISTPFRVNIPASNMSRLGHYKQAYYITQWYPKPAVYDKNGWNYFSYIDKGEFYGEFGTFDVYITLPENYRLAATGIIQESEERDWLARQDSITRKIEKFPETDSFPPSSKNLKTIHLHQENIHDFAWFADKRWNVKIDTMKLESGRIIKVRSFFNNAQSKNWLKVNDIIKDAVRHYSGLVGEYPYGAVTAVDVGWADGGGMEYPMITAINSSTSFRFFETTIIHEVGHNWFYGILGNNERCHGWMDEGVNKFYETLYKNQKYPNDSTRMAIRLTKNKVLRPKKWEMKSEQKFLFNYLMTARVNRDQSADICGEQLNLKNYSTIIYHKPAFSLNYLRTYLGDSLFNLCMKNYYENWKFKHPDPYDMKDAFEKTSGKKLDWLFDGLLISRKKLDYSIACIRNENDTLKVTVKNNKEINAPFTLSRIKEQKIISTEWHEGFSGSVKIQLLDSGASAVRIDPLGEMPELYANNNIIRTHGLFKKCEPVKFTLGTSIEKPGTSQIFYTPVAGWNNYNGAMAGIVFHNISFLEKKFEYRLMPMYAFGTNDLAGGGDLAYHIYPAGNIYRITFRSGISHYAFGNDSYVAPTDGFEYEGKLYYTKLDSRIILSVREKEEFKKINNEFSIRHIYINRTLPYQYHYSSQNKVANYIQLEYLHQNLNPLEKGMKRITATGNESYIQLAGELKQFFNYNSDKKGFEARVYGGFMYVDVSTPEGMEHRMSLSGKTGNEDYLFDEVFLGRSEDSGILAHQFAQDYAGFKAPTSYYRLAEKWMAGLNVSTTLPGMIPFRLFANVGTFNDHAIADVAGNISWEFGVDWPVIKDIFIISLPFAYSEDIKYALDQQDLKGGELIRFELHLNKLNPLDYIKNLYR